MKCEICGNTLKRHRRRAGMYRLYVCCNCQKEFFFDCRPIKWDCPKYQDCALAGKVKCKECGKEAV